jgi:FixJ family two-component response regulator
LAAELTALCPAMRVVYMSGYSGVAPDGAGQMVGNAGYLEKPFAASALTEKVREALESRP